jgi:hypothetical protein
MPFAAPLNASVRRLYGGGKVMMRKLLMGLAILSMSSTSIGAQSQTDDTSHPFNISSMESGFAYAANIEGEYRILPERIELTVSKMMIYLLDNAPYKGERKLASVRAALATEKSEGGSSWRITEKSKEVSIERLMQPGDEYTLENLKFTITKDHATDMAKHWLVFSIESYTLELGEARAKQPGYSYAHSAHNIFSMF